jgi:hypothetical protein
MTAGVGETMLRSGQMQELEAIQVLEPVRVGGLASYTIGPGYYVKRGEDARGQYFGVAFVAGAGFVSAGAISEPSTTLLLRPDGSTLCALSSMGALCRSQAPVKRAGLQASASLQQTLIYKGRTAGRVRIGYREYSGDTPRGDLSNDIDYDLKGSGMVGYKGARLEIIKATNQYVLYKVVRDFGGPGGDEMAASDETAARTAVPAHPALASAAKSLNQKLK